MLVIPDHRQWWQPGPDDRPLNQIKPREFPAPLTPGISGQILAFAPDRYSNIPRQTAVIFSASLVSVKQKCFPENRKLDGLHGWPIAKPDHERCLTSRQQSSHDRQEEYLASDP